MSFSMLSKVALQGRSTHGYEDFPVEPDTDEREAHLDEFVGPQLEPQLSTLTWVSSLTGSGLDVISIYPICYRGCSILCLVHPLLKALDAQLE